LIVFVRAFLTYTSLCKIPVESFFDGMQDDVRCSSFQKRVTCHAVRIVVSTRLASSRRRPVRFVSVQQVRLRREFSRLRHTAFLMGTLKSTPVRAIIKSVPAEGRPQFSDLPVLLCPGYKGLHTLCHQAAIGAA
jgi:hypothetical protein